MIPNKLTNDVDNKNSLKVIESVPSQNTNENENIDIESENERLKAENLTLKAQLVKLQAENDELKKQNKKIHQDRYLWLNKIPMRSQDRYHVLKYKMRERKLMPKTRLFGHFEKVFGAETIRKLRRLDNSKKKDSTFILECMRNLIGNGAELKDVTACGRKHGKNRENSLFAPEKREILDDIFIERLTIQPMDDDELSKRYFSLNNLINTAINNIVRVSRVHILPVQKFRNECCGSFTLNEFYLFCHSLGQKCEKITQDTE